ncbi:MAG: sulfide/dihydroorotate dehydrogenase-like FAD/NAD-binding protein [Betaproteobacteria bacterium]|nr:sulfide/dihydroorotate dehydrogenase-like FAD/NAD-binding protein [Betaproteobacteria bacterium]MCL2885247.1 sulfide/dihydroorotate dehydrogenase-like FAD/NAD-binding protein [Betaproteobacteria bacterium]
MNTMNSELALLARRLQADPRSFRDFLIADGAAAVAACFASGEELSGEFVKSAWEVLLAGGDAAAAFMRFLWYLPIGKQRLWLRGVDAHLSERYPMFQGLSQEWPANSGMGPYIRPPEERSEDFGLVNKGYMGYMDLGYSLREVELFVWLESLRDKQCAEMPCEIGRLQDGKKKREGGCPVQVHIPTMFKLLGMGKFDEAVAMLNDCNPLPNVTGRVCPQEIQCQGVCMHKHPMSIGQVEWFLPEWDKAANPGEALRRLEGRPDPWQTSAKPPVAIVGSGPSGLINAFLLANAGHPVTIFEAFHELGGVLRYGIPEFRLPNTLIDDVVEKIRTLGGRFVTNFVIGKTATLQDLKDAGFAHIFVGSGAGLPQFLNVPGEHLLNVMSANEFLTRVNLMHADSPEHETPMPYVDGRQVIIIGGGNTAMDAARTARRLRGKVTIVYRRTKSEMPARVEELEHAEEEGIELRLLRSPIEFLGDDKHFVKQAVLDVMELGAPDSSGRRRPMPTGKTELIDADVVIMALGNAPNPIIRESEPRLSVDKKGIIQLREGSQETSLDGVYTGGDAARGGSTAILAAGDGQSAAKQIMTASGASGDRAKALAFTEQAQTAPVILARRDLSPGIVEFRVKAPAIAAAAKAGQFVRVHPRDRGELIPLTLADWNADEGWITLVIQGVGVASIEMNRMQVGERFQGIAGPLGRPSHLEKVDGTVVFTAGGLGLPPVYPIMREHLRLGNHVTLIAGFRSKELMFWTGEDDYVGQIKAEFGDLLDIVYTTNDGSHGIAGFVTAPLQKMLEDKAPIAKVVTIGPPLMMRSVSDLTKPYGVPTEASLNSIMVDATGMCGACMVPYYENGEMVRKHACIDGPELDAHLIDWDKFLPRFNLFKEQEAEARARHGY